MRECKRQRRWIDALGLDSGNYLLSSANASGGTITPATVGASLVGTVQKVFDGTSSAVLIPANYQLSGVVPDDSVILNSPANGNYADKNAGSAKIVSVGGLTLLGLDSGNYLLSSANASGAIGTITPATVGASLVGTVQKVFDGTTSAVLIPANYQLSGVVPGDSVTLNSPANGNYADENAGSAKIVSVGGLTLLGSDGANYVLVSSNASADIGVISGVISATLITNAIGNSYTSGTARNVSPGSAPTGGTGPQPVSDATSDTGGAQGDAAQTDGAAAALGKSLGGGAQSSSSVLIDGLLRQFSATPGNSNPHGVPPYGQVYSSWGNEAFWQ